jgi:serine/threonine-protein kinase HipA
VICRAFGLEAARADFHHYDGNPVIVVERIDRQWQEGVLYRLPQEDICQALGVPPLRKYERDGGPGIVDVLSILNGAVSPREDRLSFMKAQIVFWLLAAIDGHAKNFSIFLTPDGYKLTPLYDVMSTAPYSALLDHKVKLVMAVGNSRHYRLKEIQPRHFYQTGQKAGLGKQDMDDLFADLLAKVDTALATVEKQAGLAGVPQTTLEPILDGMKRWIRMNVQ